MGIAASNAYKNSYIKEKYDRVNLTLPKGMKEVVKAHAEQQGESVNSFIYRAIDETMKRDRTKKTALPEGGAV